MTTTTTKKPYRRKTSAGNDERKAALRAIAAELDGQLKDGKHAERLARVPQETPGIERYSPLNQLLLLTQCPHVTEVHSYREWQKQGFQVRLGEKGLGIRAPHERPAEEGKAKQVGFHITYVFDTSQVEPIKEPTPEEAAYVRSLGENEDIE